MSLVVYIKRRTQTMQSGCLPVAISATLFDRIEQYFECIKLKLAIQAQPRIAHITVATSTPRTETHDVLYVSGKLLGMGLGPPATRPN